MADIRQLLSLLSWENRQKFPVCWSGPPNVMLASAAWQGKKRLVSIGSSCTDYGFPGGLLLFLNPIYNPTTTTLFTTRICLRENLCAAGDDPLHFGLGQSGLDRWVGMGLGIKAKAAGIPRSS